MRRGCDAGLLIIAAVVLCTVPSRANAQICVNWSVFSCKDYAPSAKVLANPEDRFPLGSPRHQRAHIIGQREGRHMHVGAPVIGWMSSEKSTVRRRS